MNSIVSRLRDSANAGTFEPADMREAADLLEKLLQNGDERLHRFLPVSPIELNGQDVCLNPGWDRVSTSGSLWLTVEEAKELRDWLNKALPYELR